MSFKNAILGLVALQAAVCLAVNNEAPTYIRGVEFNRIPLYNQLDGEFRCLDGSKTILADQINDDYCDCADGSDEPGTSACPNGRFFCANKGHQSEYIPSSRVNDKICDCCDGSDEYAGTSCPNICDELGKSAREEKERLAGVARKGFAARKELAKQGQQLKEEKVNAAVPIRAQRDELVPKRDALTTQKTELEEKERKMKDEHRNKWQASKDDKRKEKAQALFKEIDAAGKGKITLLDVQSLHYLDADNDGQVSEAEAHHYLSGEEADFDVFFTSMYDNLKTAKSNFEHRARAREQHPEEDDLVAEEDKGHPEPEELADEHDEEDEVMPAYDAETQAVIDEAEKLRNEYRDLDSKIRDYDNQINEADSFNSADFGEDLAWAPLKGQCFELNELQYVYKMCPFDKTVQKDKSGYGETSLGNYKEWAGAAPRKYSAQKYDGGQQCWNGPQRSTLVRVECGETNELVSASEPAKCEYEFVFRTPAVCTDPDREPPVHTEL